MLEGENQARILLVEESPTDRALLERALRNCVTVVLDAEAALEAARRQSFAAVLLGDALPGGRAFDVLRELHAAVGETPIVFMTAGADEEIGEAARDAGAAAWVVKEPGFEEAISSLLGVMTTRIDPPSERAAAPSAAARDLLVLDVDGQRHGVRVADVEMIARAVTIVPIPGTPPGVEGCIVYRGRLVIVLDLRARLGLAPKPLDENQHLVLLRATRRLVALRVDRAIEVVHLEGGLRRVDAIDVGGGAVLGVAQLPEGPVVVYDVDALATASGGDVITRTAGAHDGVR
ncbi:MAG: chemotaxis protein CheW [Deltaproteobacteria bacterium]|nr:chemotaxis protein CheW [Deltaproteobacteria bacterium]